MNKEILDKIKVAQKVDKRTHMTISDRFIKLVEEKGEIASAHLKERGLKLLEPGETMEDVRKNKKEEYADALIVIFDLILCDGFTFEEVEEEMHKGIDKWYDKWYEKTDRLNKPKKHKGFEFGDKVRCINEGVAMICGATTKKENYGKRSDVGNGYDFDTSKIYIVEKTGLNFGDNIVILVFGSSQYTHEDNFEKVEDEG